MAASALEKEPSCLLLLVAPTDTDPNRKDQTGVYLLAGPAGGASIGSAHVQVDDHLHMFSCAGLSQTASETSMSLTKAACVDCLESSLICPEGSALAKHTILQSAFLHFALV